jgi:hypothetical protein
MAISIKVPRKKPRAKINRKTGFTDPDWSSAETWSGDKFHKERSAFARLYYQNVKTADLRGYVYEYMKQNEYSASDIKAAKAVSHIPVQVGIYAKLLTTGMPDLQQNHADMWRGLKGTSSELKPVSEFVSGGIADVITEGLLIVGNEELIEEVSAVAVSAAPSIQDIMRKAATIMCEPIDDSIEDFVVSRDIKLVAQFDPHTILIVADAKANHARIIKSFYSDVYEELLEAASIPKPAAFKKLSEEDQDACEQLAEAYSHFNAKQLAAIIAMHKKIIDACDIVIVEQKATKAPRKVKQKSADQLVSKLKFKSNDSSYGIASVAPSGLIGAVAAVVFNCKNRKLGLYVAIDADGFKVKGTTLLNFNEEVSTQKTLRKPGDVLPEFKKITKPKALKTFKSLTTTDTKLNGRFNDETIILAVFK